jgi:hypothetical protein
VESRWIRRALVLLALLGGALALLVAATGGFRDAVRTGLIVAGAVFLATLAFVLLAPEAPHDRGRRRLLLGAAGAGMAIAVGGAALGRLVKRVLLPDPAPVMDAMAHGLGEEYMELVRRTFHPERSGDLQLLLAPFNSANYAAESLQLQRFYPNTSHASVWMYLERVPLVVYAPGLVPPSDSDERVDLADIAPTIADLIGFEGWPEDRDGTSLLPGGLGDPLRTLRPKVVVTFVIDGGGWNVLEEWPDAWPNLRRLMGEGANFRNAITGSFPAVTACAHATIGTGTYPRTHGISGHNIRTPEGVRKAYGTAGHADPADILVPTLADLWSEATDNRAWVGEIGYQVWHLGMLGRGGPTRSGVELPVAVYWDEAHTQTWQPHNPELYRLAAETPGLDRLAEHQAAFTPPAPSPYDPNPAGHKAVCCTPPIVAYQGDVIEAAFDSEPIGQGEESSLLFINYKAPDYAGHIYNMLDEREATALAEVDRQLGRLAAMLEDRYGRGGFALIVTADHGQCPLPDDVGGTRVDPIQLRIDIEAKFHGGEQRLVEEIVPSEVYLNDDALREIGVTRADVAASLADYRYRQNIGPYVPSSAIEQDLLDNEEFAAVFPTEFLASLADRDLAVYGACEYEHTDPTGIPGRVGA